MSMEIRAVQYWVKVKDESLYDGERLEYTRYVLQYRHVDWGKWKTVPVVLCEEGQTPSED